MFHSFYTSFIDRRHFHTGLFGLQQHVSTNSPFSLGKRKKLSQLQMNFKMLAEERESLLTLQVNPRAVHYSVNADGRGDLRPELKFREEVTKTLGISFKFWLQMSWINFRSVYWIELDCLK